MAQLRAEERMHDDALIRLSRAQADLTEAEQSRDTQHWLNKRLADRVAAQSELLSKAAEREKELVRIREGELTPEEFHNLCHNLDKKGRPCTRAEHAAACNAYRDKLFASTPSVEDPLSPTWARPVPKFDVGDRAYVKIDGLWRPGEVLMVFRDGSCELKLDDGWNVRTAEAKTFEEFDKELRACA